MKPIPVPLTESLFPFSRAWRERKDTVIGQAITKRCPVIFKQGLWDRKANPHCLCSWLLSTTSSIRLPILDYGFCSLPSVLILCLYSFILICSSVLTYALTMSKQHLQFVKEGKLLWSSKLIIRVSSLCQRYVKETLSIIDRRYLAKLNTLPDTFCLSGCDGDSSYWHTGWGCLFGQARPTFIIVIHDIFCHILQSPWKGILLQR